MADLELIDLQNLHEANEKKLKLFLLPKDEADKNDMYYWGDASFNHWPESGKLAEFHDLSYIHSAVYHDMLLDQIEKQNFRILITQ